MFDLQQFQAGVPAIDRDGREWTFDRDTDRHLYSVGATSSDGLALCFTKDGRYWARDTSAFDLIAMKEPEKKQEPASQFEVGQLVRHTFSGPAVVVQVSGTDVVYRCDSDGKLYISRRLAEFEPMGPETEEVTLYLNVYREDGRLFAYVHTSEALADNAAADDSGKESRLTGKAIPATVKLPK